MSHIVLEPRPRLRDRLRGLLDMVVAAGHLLIKGGHLVMVGGHLREDSGSTGCAACCPGTPPAKVLVTFPSDLLFDTSLIPTGPGQTIQWTDAAGVLAGTSHCLSYIGSPLGPYYWTGSTNVNISTNGAAAVPTPMWFEFQLNFGGCNLNFFMNLGGGSPDPNGSQYKGIRVVGGVIDPCVTAVSFPLTKFVYPFSVTATTGNIVVTPGGC